MEPTTELINEYIAQLTKEVQNNRTEFILLKSQLTIKEKEVEELKVSIKKLEDKKNLKNS